MLMLLAVLGGIALARAYEPRLVEWPMNLLSTNETLKLSGKEPEQVAGYFKVCHRWCDLASLQCVRTLKRVSYSNVWIFCCVSTLASFYLIFLEGARCEAVSFARSAFKEVL